MSSRPRAFSGIQPSGEIHVGNYLGAIRNWVGMLDRFECIFCVVNYHAMTVEYDIPEMRRRILDAARINIACGIDPERATLFLQSDVPEHAELNWYLTTVTPMGELSRMTQFKDKSARHPDNVNAGLFVYPVLMAADIVLYKATHVPVGDDQLQHLELCRESVRRFNARFGDLFPEPKGLVGNAPRVMGLDGKAKMSKSLGNHLGVLDSSEVVRQKLKPAFTDPARLRRTDPGNPEICNIFTMHKGFSPEELVAQIDRDCRVAGIGCGDCKLRLAEQIDRVLGPVREKAAELAAKPQYVRDVLDAGADRCRAIARETLREVMDAVGFPPRARERA